MSNFAKQEIAPEKDKLILQQGKTVAFVSGLAGVEIRPWRNNLEKNPVNNFYFLFLTEF